MSTSRIGLVSNSLSSPKKRMRFTEVLVGLMHLPEELIELILQFLDLPDFIFGFYPLLVCKRWNRISRRVLKQSPFSLEIDEHKLAQQEENYALQLATALSLRSPPPKTNLRVRSPSSPSFLEEREEPLTLTVRESEQQDSQLVHASFVRMSLPTTLKHPDRLKRFLQRVSMLCDNIVRVEFSHCKNLTDEALITFFKKSAKTLRTVVLEDCEWITDKSIKKLVRLSCKGAPISTTTSEPRKSTATNNNNNEEEEEEATAIYAKQESRIERIDIADCPNIYGTSLHDIGTFCTSLRVLSFVLGCGKSSTQSMQARAHLGTLASSPSSFSSPSSSFRNPRSPSLASPCFRASSSSSPSSFAFASSSASPRSPAAAFNQELRNQENFSMLSNLPVHLASPARGGAIMSPINNNIRRNTTIIGGTGNLSSPSGTFRPPTNPQQRSFTVYDDNLGAPTATTTATPVTAGSSAATSSSNARQHLSWNCHKLIYCFLGNVRLQDSFVSRLIRGSPRLQFLHLHNCGTLVTDASISLLPKHCPRIQILELSRSSLTNSGLDKVVRGLPRLCCLDVSDCSLLTDDALNSIANYNSDKRKLTMAEAMPIDDNRGRATESDSYFENDGVISHGIKALYISGVGKKFGDGRITEAAIKDVQKHVPHVICRK